MIVDKLIEPLADVFNSKLKMKVVIANFGRAACKQRFYLVFDQDVTDEQVFSLAYYLNPKILINFNKEINGGPYQDVLNIHWIFRSPENNCEDAESCKKYKLKYLYELIEYLDNYI